jgi:hypothetical protein
VEGFRLECQEASLGCLESSHKTKKEGGLGIINLQTQNDALLMKNLHKFFNKLDCPWVSLIWENYYRNGKLHDERPRGSFWWRAVLKLLNKFKGISMVQIKNGATVSLWNDLWNGQVRQQALPELYSFSTKREITVNQAKSMRALHDIFQLPMSPEAFQQYNSLREEIDFLEITQPVLSAQSIYYLIWPHGNTPCF